MKFRVHWAVLTALACASPAWAQDPVTTGPETTVDEIVVVGGTLEEQAAQFVDGIANSTTRRGLARWAGPVCIGVVNFRREVAEQIADTMVEIADEFGVPVNAEACEPNIFIIGAVDGQALAAKWVAERPSEFRPTLPGLRSSELRPSMASLDLFMQAPAPVRWYSLSVPVDRTGRQASPRLIRTLRVDDLWRVFVVVDVDEIDGYSVRSLSEYISMVAFSQVQMDADTSGLPSIINMFHGDYDRFTPWDHAYLSTLYEADHDERVTHADQAENLASAMRTPDPEE